MLTREEVWNAWAPAESPWSRWAKGVLFAFMPEVVPKEDPPVISGWRVPLAGNTALMVELPGAAGVETGVELARSGYRPVPLYNACPHPFPAEAGAKMLPPAAALCAVDVAAIRRAMEERSHALEGIALPPSAPPAFLLDAQRDTPAVKPTLGWFDNRSVVRETDVPTAAFLREQGIREVVLVQGKAALPSDLRLVLRAWQEGGLAVARQTAGEAWRPQALVVPKMSALRLWWERWLLRLTCPPNAAGSFGRFVSNATG